jgi:hypothetical protein
MIGAIAIGQLVSRFPQLRLDGEPKRQQNMHMRGFTSLPVAVK